MKSSQTAKVLAVQRICDEDGKAVREDKGGIGSMMTKSSWRGGGYGRARSRPRWVSTGHGYHPLRHHVVLPRFTMQFEDVGGSSPSMAMVASSSAREGRPDGLGGELGRRRCL
jgi:hypothetical protein